MKEKQVTAPRRTVHCFIKTAPQGQGTRPPHSMSQSVIQSVIQFSRSVMSDSLQPMNRSTPGLPVRPQLPEFTQTHVHRVGDAIQPSHALSSPSPPAPKPSQYQGLFQ